MRDAGARDEGLAAGRPGPEAEAGGGGAGQAVPAGPARRARRGRTVPCAVPGCAARIAFPGTASVCRPHLHTPGVCTCVRCRRMTARLPAVRRALAQGCSVDQAAVRAGVARGTVRRLIAVEGLPLPAPVVVAEPPQPMRKPELRPLADAERARIARDYGVAPERVPASVCHVPAGLSGEIVGGWREQTEADVRRAARRRRMRALLRREGRL